MMFNMLSRQHVRRYQQKTCSVKNEFMRFLVVVEHQYRWRPEQR